MRQTVDFDPEPQPHLVHYQKHRVIHIPPDENLWWTPVRPSDCTWMVPGSAHLTDPRLT